jgi:hypothetical protein
VLGERRREGEGIATGILFAGSFVPETKVLSRRRDFWRSGACHFSALQTANLESRTKTSSRTSEGIQKFLSEVD